MKKNYYVNGWTESEERKLAEIMVDGIKAGYAMHVLFHLAEENIGRSHKSCMNRWYSIRHTFLKEII